ncbi:sporulation protein YunB [Phosphitispora fastidiosa]|uniref:sporulation protein YunB n=1 Tax=Phosphitispora fastidiosa TaxID=2837202 RepID=UPI001E48D2E6|nr:sporulation protein YunB [Phosphitispora fastidiosa]MBU7007260.1 sporulation protein YunB [Phosphitispora fastidiosa]
MFQQHRFPVKMAGVILVVAIILVVPLFIVERNLKPTIITIAKAYAEQTAVDAIQNAVNEKIAKSVEYKDLIFIRTDNRGRIVLMQANTVKINSLAADTVLDIQKSLASLEGKEIPIPMGQVLQSQLFAAYGPKIKVTLVPIGTVKVKVIDDFQQAGINQTRHRLYLNVSGRVKIVIPMASDYVEVTSQIPIAETIIVGEVPETYLNLDIPNGQFNGISVPK